MTIERYLMSSQKSSGPNYWIAEISIAEDNYGTNKIAVDSGNNIYVTGYKSYNGYLAKINKNGALQWQRYYDYTYDYSYGVAVDSSDNILMAVQTENSSSAGVIGTVKIDASGSITWQRILSATYGAYPYAITTDSSGNVYSSGQGSENYTGILTAKYNSSGSLQWQRNFLPVASYSAGYGNDVAVDSSGNVYVAAYSSYIGFGWTDSFLIKYNSSGSLQWQRRLSAGSSNSSSSYGVAVDSSGNPYIIINSNAYGIGLVKYNSSGTLQWQRTIDYEGYDKGYNIAIDGSNNIYIVGKGYETVDYYQGILIVKYNSSGTLQWQRILYKQSSTSEGYGVRINSAGDVCISGKFEFSSSAKIVVAKLPSDGSLTGTYGSWIYADAGHTDAAGSLTDTAGGGTDAAGAGTDDAGSLTGSTASLTSTTTTLQ